jgi:arginine decarboxylase
LKQTFATYLETQFGVTADGALNEFISREHERVLFAGLDLQALAEEHGAPLEIVYCPLITQQVQQMQRAAAQAQVRAGYAGGFVYAYASKANFAEEAVRTALEAGAHYETSSVADVMIATELWHAGRLPAGRYVFCNGSKEDNYIDAILRFRRAGNSRVVPVVDDLDEWDAYRDSTLSLDLGVRAREYAKCSGGDRFGLLPDEIDQVIEDLAGTSHRLVLYHAMVGSQLADQDTWLAKLEAAVEAYCRLRQRVPTLRMFNFGGGMPTAAYALDFQFDYAGFMEKLFATIKETCARYDVPVPDVVGEFGRYTVASHSAYVFEVGKVKRGRNGAAPWYLINGSLMVSAPDTLIVDDQQFIILPLGDWNQPAQAVQLGGRRTCDSDDVYPRPGQPELVLPETEGGMLIAVFGVGAYQGMLSGRGGAHHCLNPEMTRIIVEQRGERLVTRVVRQQSVAQIKQALGYERVPQPVRKRRLPVPASRRGDVWRTIARLDNQRVPTDRCELVLSS